MDNAKAKQTGKTPWLTFTWLAGVCVIAATTAFIFINGSAWVVNKIVRYHHEHNYYIDNDGYPIPKVDVPGCGTWQSTPDGEGGFKWVKVPDEDTSQWYMLAPSKDGGVRLVPLNPKTRPTTDSVDGWHQVTTRPGANGGIEITVPLPGADTEPATQPAVQAQLWITIKAGNGLPGSPSLGEVLHLIDDLVKVTKIEEKEKMSGNPSYNVWVTSTKVDLIRALNLLKINSAVVSVHPAPG